MPAILTHRPAYHRPRPRLTLSSLLIYDIDGGEFFKHRASFLYAIPLSDETIQTHWNDGDRLTLDRGEWSYLRHAWHVS